MKNLEKAILRASDELGIDRKEARLAYMLYWRYFREHISSMEIRKNMSKDEFDALHASFNIPSLGKFCCTYDRYLRLKTQEKFGQNVKNSRMQADAESCNSDGKQI